MKRIFRLWFATLTLLMSTLGALAQPAKTTDAAEAARTALAATVATSRADVRSPDLLEHIVDVFLRFFNVTSSGNTAIHYAISAVFIVGAILLRRFLTTIFFNQLKKLAAQDTIANLFGSLVVAIDQPFKIGETVKIGTHTGTVEDIGLRSTKIRLIDKSLVVMPNKLVSSEAIVNLSRSTQRRVEQVIGLTYDTTPDQLAVIVEDFRGILLADAEVDPTSVMVFFRDLSASSLDVWVVYASREADVKEGFALKQRMNLAIMRAVAARRLSFAYPTSVMHLDGPVAKALVGGKG